ncbi:MAG: RNA polymerase sigma factor [Rubripirellula sp.]
MVDTDVSLLNRVIRGDDRAWEEFVRWYLPLVYHWCRQWNLSADTSADVTQEVFLKVSQGLPRIERAESFSSFRGWLRTLARNVMIDWLRKHGDEIVAQGGTTAQQILASFEANDDSCGSSPIDEMRLAKVDELRATFSDRDWNAFWLTTVEGLSGQEAATELGMRRGAIYQAKYRVLTGIRAVFDDLAEE